MQEGQHVLLLINSSLTMMKFESPGEFVHIDLMSLEVQNDMTVIDHNWLRFRVSVFRRISVSVVKKICITIFTIRLTASKTLYQNIHN